LLELVWRNPSRSSRLDASKLHRFDPGFLPRAHSRSLSQNAMFWRGLSSSTEKPFWGSGGNLKLNATERFKAKWTRRARQQKIVGKSESNTKSCVRRWTLGTNGPRERSQYWAILDVRKAFFSGSDPRFLCLRPWQKNAGKMGLACTRRQTARDDGAGDRTGKSGSYPTLESLILGIESER